MVDKLEEAFRAGWEKCWQRDPDAPCAVDGGKRAAWERYAATLSTPANGEQVERAAYRMAYAPLRSAQHAFDIIARGTPHISAVQELAREESERIGIALATLSTPTEDARERVKVLEEALREIVAEADKAGSDAGLNLAAIIAEAALGNKETDRHG